MPVARAASSKRGSANPVIPLLPSFVWGPLPSRIELEGIAASFALEMTGPQVFDRLDHTGQRLQAAQTEGLGLVDFCRRFDVVQLWVDPTPNDQLTLIWLLDYLRRHAKTVSKLTLIKTGRSLSYCTPEELAGWRLAAVKILDEHRQTAGPAWTPFRQPTPQPGSTCSARTSASCRIFDTAACRKPLEEFLWP